ncbi:MAG: preprotein translocase subunit YajC, partial [Bacteroidia bacterium]|nr:preprotein translocase subunit YajC [Bacteroidia bacterium]
FREALKKGDKVITIGGLHGKIVEIEENGTVLLDVGDNTKLRFDKNAIREYAPSQASSSKS